MISNPNAQDPSDRKPVFVDPRVRKLNIARGDDQRAVALRETGQRAIAAYERAAGFYEQVHNPTYDSYAADMKRSAEALRAGGEAAAQIYYKVAAHHDSSGKYDLANNMRKNAHVVLTSASRNTASRRPESSLAASVISIGILGALIFFYNGITGNAIGGMEKETSEWIGVVLLLIAIGFGAFYVMRKAKKRK